MSETPNVVVNNPTVRKAANIVLGVALIVLPVAQIVQTETALDFSAWLPAALAVTAFLAGAFGLAVTTPNVPKSRGAHGVAADEYEPGFNDIDHDY